MQLAAAASYHHDARVCITSTSEYVMSFVPRGFDCPSRSNSLLGSGGDGDVDAGCALSEAAARATIFARVVSVMNGRSGLRPEVLTFLCDLLNNGITPLLAKDGGEGPSLAKAVLGAGSCMFKGDVR